MERFIYGLKKYAPDITIIANDELLPEVKGCTGRRSQYLFATEELHNGRFIQGCYCQRISLNPQVGGLRAF